MGKQIGKKGEIVLGYLEKYPVLPSRTLARMLYDNHPVLFSGTEDARTSVRYYRGRNGGPARDRLVDKRFLLPEPTERNPFSLPPSSMIEYTDYHIPSELERGMIFGDIHIPYHDKKAVETVLYYGKEFKPDFILLNGDLFDHYQISEFHKDPTKDDIKKEVELGRQFLTALRVQFPDAMIIWKKGNHDDRFKTYIQHNAPQIWGLDGFTAEGALDIFHLGIHVVEDKRRIRSGKLFIVHGHEFWRSINNPVNPARGLFLKAKWVSMCSHFHQTSQHTEPNIKDEMITCWSTGCLCQLHPEYSPINNWNHGFATQVKTPSGSFKVDNYRILNGDIF